MCKLFHLWKNVRQDLVTGQQQHLWTEMISHILYWYGCLLFVFIINHLARTSSTMLNRNSESGHPCFVPNLRRKALSFSLLCVKLAMDFSCMAFIMLRYNLSVLSLLSLFRMKQCQILSNAFSISIKIIMWFLVFILLIWCILHIDWFPYVETYLHPRDKSYLVIMYDPFKVCWIWYGSILLRVKNIYIHQEYWAQIVFSLALVIQA